MNEPNVTEQSQDVAAGCAQATGSATHRTIHMCVDIEGVMRWPDKDLARMFSDDGIRRSGKYVRDWLKLQLAQGKRVLPMGKPCEGFSYTDGCPGHPDESPNAKLRQDAPANPNS
jgi:hypothetical protein